MTRLATVYTICNIGVETASGDAVPANKRLSGLMIEPQPKIEISQYRGTGYKFKTVAGLNKEWTEAELSGPVTYTEIVYLLSSLLDTAAITTPGGGTASRAWTFAADSNAADAPKTFTVEIGDATRAQEFAYGLVKDLTLTFSREGCELSGTMIGEALVDGITLTVGPTAIALMPVFPTQVSVYLQDTYAALPGTALTAVVSAEWSLTDRYNPAFFLDGGTTLASHVEVEPTGTLKLKMEADSVGMGMLTAMRAGSSKFMRIEGVGSIIEAAITYELTIDACGKVTGEPKFSDEDGIRCIEWEMEIYHDATWGKATQIVAVNNLTALYTGTCMPIELSQLKANTRTIVVPYYGDTVTVTYRPSEMTPLRENAIRAGATDGDNLPMLETLSAMIIEWDVLGGDDKPIDRSVEVMEELPSAFLTAIFTAIREDMSPKAKSARGSFAR